MTCNSNNKGCLPFGNPLKPSASQPKAGFLQKSRLALASKTSVKKVLPGRTKKQRMRCFKQTLVALGALLVTVIGNSSPLTEQQLIQQGERLFKARLISISPQPTTHLYSIRMITKDAQIIFVEANAKTGEMKKINEAPSINKANDKSK